MPICKTNVKIFRDKPARVNKTEKLYSGLLPIKIVSFDDIVQASSGLIDGRASRKYVYHKYVKRLVEAQFYEFQLRNHLLIALLICLAIVSISFLSGFIP